MTQRYNISEQVGDFDAERHVKRFFTLSNNATNHEAVRMCVQGLHEDLDEMCSLVRSLSTKRPDRSFGNAGSPAGSCVSEEDEDQSTSKASVQYSPAKENCAGKSDLITECDCTDGSDSGSCVTENDEEEWEDCEEGNGQSETSSNSDDVGTETVKAQEILQQSEKSIPVALETMQETRKREEREKEREEWEIERDEVRRQMECLLLHLANGEREREREREQEEMNQAEDERRREWRGQWKGIGERVHERAKGAGTGKGGKANMRRLRSKKRSWRCCWMRKGKRREKRKKKGRR